MPIPSYLKVHDVLQLGFYNKFDIGYEDWLNSMYKYTGIADYSKRLIVMLLLTEIVARALRCTVRCQDPLRVLLPYRESDTDPSEPDSSDGDDENFNAYLQRKNVRQEAAEARQQRRKQRRQDGEAKVREARQLQKFVEHETRMKSMR